MVTPTQCDSDNDGTVTAKVCDTLMLNEYNDWYLPSKDELNTLYGQKNLVGGFATSTYWSSSEFNSSDTRVQIFGSGGRFNINKDGDHYVRCVRGFSSTPSNLQKFYSTATQKLM